MGSNRYTPWTPEERREYEARVRAQKAEEAKQLQGARTSLAEKIVSVAIDKINADIIRPGPHPEERECYDMADELRRYKAELVEIVVAQLNVNEGCD